MSKPGPAGRLRFAKEDATGAIPQNPTSGQVGPKLRQESKQARPSQRLQHEDDAPPDGEAGARPDDGPSPADKKAERDNKRFEKSTLKAEKSGVKLETAREKLAAQKPPKKPGIGRAIGNAAKYQAWRYAHGKVHQVEHENVGVEAAHRTELAGETVIRGTTRFVKQRVRTRPARQVRKWEQRNIKAKADLQFRTMAVSVK